MIRTSTNDKQTTTLLSKIGSGHHKISFLRRRLILRTRYSDGKYYLHVVVIEEFPSERTSAPRVCSLGQN